MNYTGTLDSAVSTLAHEMGHSHTWLTNHTQPFQYDEYTMFVAEVATVNENLLIDQLLEKKQI